MGLAGNKSRTKLSSDPNNNAWAKSTTSFGHKILSSHGWKPGQYLGATNAAHAAHYTQANASHIRVLLRDDNLGLGAPRPGAKNAETFGLLQFSGLLGRLNGRPEKPAEEERRRDLELAAYQGRKYGLVRFVSAGYLVGDRMEDLETGIQRTKKRRREDDDCDPASGTHPVHQDSKLTESNLDERKNKKARKEARRRDREERRETKARLKLAKKAAKDAAGTHEHTADLETAVNLAVTSPDDEDQSVATPVVRSTEAPRAIPTASLNRLAVRRRYIQQKRMAALDPKALNEVRV